MKRTELIQLRDKYLMYWQCACVENNRVQMRYWKGKYEEVKAELSEG